MIDDFQEGESIERLVRPVRMPNLNPIEGLWIWILKDWWRYKPKTSVVYWSFSGNKALLNVYIMQHRSVEVMKHFLAHTHSWHSSFNNKAINSACVLVFFNFWTGHFFTSWLPYSGLLLPNCQISPVNITWFGRACWKIQALVLWETNFCWDVYDWSHLVILKMPGYINQLE